MRILHLSDSDGQGGAARSAWRLHRGLTALGQESAMLVRDKTSADSAVFTARLEFSSAAKKHLAHLKCVENHWIKSHRTEISNTWFSVPAAGYDLSRNPHVLAAEVLNLHWVTGLLSPPALARLQQLGRPVFWTLHDQRPFTGGCHFSAGCRGYEQSCADCPQLSPDSPPLAAAGLRESLHCLNARKLTVVCPSRWLADCAHRSALFSQTRIETIPYGIETQVFQPIPKPEARRQLGLDPGAVCLLFGADNPREKRKGFAELCAVFHNALADGWFREAVASGKIKVLCFGDSRPQVENFGIPVTSLGRVETDAQLVRIYSAASVFLLPSLEDNLPNTLLEAMACGTPAIGFEIGGVPDLITPQETGLMAPIGDIPRFAELLVTLAQNESALQQMSDHCARLIPSRFTLEIQARRYLELYQPALAEKSSHPCRRLPVSSSPLLLPSPAFTKTFQSVIPLADQARRVARWQKLKRLARGKFD
jgi:glycosyltransferase involved in cell wall biosynthesis